MQAKTGGNEVNFDDEIVPVPGDGHEEGNRDDLGADSEFLL